MDPPLRQRASWREFRRAAVAVSPDRSTLARGHAYFFAAGATLALLSILLPHEPSMSEMGILACIAVAYGVSAAMILGFEAIPDSVFRGVQVLGIVLITLCVYFSGSSTSAYATGYVWVALYAAHLFGPYWAAGQVALVAGAYGGVLLADPERGSLEHWIIVVGTVIVVGVMVHGLKERLGGLIRSLDEAARTDSLTGLLNRRGLEQALEVEIERVRRGGGHLSLLVGDLDYFKAVNDRLGHAVGDAALERVSAVLRSNKRLVDVAGRLGGEEFAIVAPGADEREAYGLAERLRDEVRDAFADDAVPLTISFGVSGLPGREAAEHMTAAALMAAADRALYAAKDRGRDRSEVENPPTVAA
jgi:diguanylate cyclase (GGDEF)-like protein